MRSQRRASSSSLSNRSPGGAGNQRGGTYLQLRFPNFSLLGHTLFCSRESSLLGRCLRTAGNPPWEVSRLLDWCPRDFPQRYAGRTWDASSPAVRIAAWGCAALLLGPWWGRAGVRDVAGPGSAGGRGSSRRYFRQLPRLLGGVVTPPNRSCVPPPNWTLCSVLF